MPVDDYESLIIPALNALAASPEGTMTMTQFVAILETRFGSTEEEAADARSGASRGFERRVRAMLDGGEAGSLVERGFADLVEEGTMVRITTAGRDFIGRG